MNSFRGRKHKSSEQGIALVLALMVLLLLSAVLMGMIMMSNTETNVSSNFRDEQTAFFASKAGVEEVRDRMRSAATNSLSTFLPTTAFHLGTGAAGYRVMIAGHTPDGRIGAVRGLLPVGKAAPPPPVDR